MANNIDLVVGSEAIKQVENLILKLSLADAELIKVSQSAIRASKGISGITTPTGLDNSVNNTASLNAELLKQNTIIKTLEAQILKLKEAKLKLNSATLQEKVDARITLQNATAEAKAVSNTASAYQKLDASHKQATRSAQDIGVKFGANSREFKNAADKANVLDRELKKIDATLGKSQRNVGNYSSAFNGIGSALGAFGIVTGVAGVAMLATNIFNTTKELESLNMALKQVSGSQEELATNQAFLSRISEAYGVEIQGLTKQFTQFYVSAKDKISGAEIQGIFESVTKAGASMGLSVQNQERAFLALNQMMSKGTIQAEELRGQLGEALPGALGIMAKAVGVNEKELGKMMKAGDLISSEVLPKFVKELEKVYGIEQLARVETLSAAQTRLSSSWTEFIGSLNNGGGKLTGFLTGTLQVLNSMVQSLKDFNSTFSSIRDKSASASQKADSEIYKGLSPERKRAIALQNKEAAEWEISTLNDELKKNQAEYDKFNKISFGNLFNTGKLNDAKENIANINRSLGVERGRVMAANEALTSLVATKAQETEVIKENTKAKAKNEKRADLVSVGSPKITEENGALENLKNLRKALEKTRDETAKNATEFDQFNKSIEQVNGAIKILTEPLTVGLNITDPLKNANNEIKKTNDFLNSFISDFAQNSGFGETLNIFTDEFDFMAKTTEEKTVAIMESFQEMYNFISNASQANFEGEKQRLQDQYEISLGYAGDSAVAKAKLAEDLEQKQKEIANRENKAKQKQAIFNIAIDTAQGVISALKTGNVPLSILIGVLGAAQIAMVASQKIPQYFEGTDNHAGGLMLVNDGSGSNFREKVITPDGKQFTPQGRNVILDAPRGTRVLTHEQQIHEMLNERGVSINRYASSGGMTANEMDNVLGKHFSKIQTNVTNFDRNGFSSYSEKNGNRTINTNNRVERTGFKV